MERLKSTLGILMWFAVSTVIAYHIGILDQNPMLGTRNFSLCISALSSAMYPTSAKTKPLAFQAGLRGQLARMDDGMRLF